MQKLITQIILFYNKPYDLFESEKQRLNISIGVSGFVWFFLFSFGVFDFDYFPLITRLYITGVYSLFCLISLLVNLFLIQDYVLKKNTIASAFRWTLWLMCCIALSNFILTTLVFKWEEFSLFCLVKNQIYVICIGMIVTPAILLLHYNHILKKRIREISNLHIKPNHEIIKEPIIFLSKYKDSQLIIDINHLLYIQCVDNYIDIFSKCNTSNQHKLLRNTLAYVEESIAHPALIRCHRSFIVNINQVKSVRGNTGGYKLIIENSDVEIPISRKYKNSVFSSLKK